MYRPHLPSTGPEGNARGTDFKMACPIPAPQPLDRETRRLFRYVNAWARIAHPRLYLWIIGKPRSFGPYPSVALPRTLNAKYTWRKIFDHDPRFKAVSDKLAVRDFCAGIRPDLRAPEVLWSGTDPGDIPDAVLKGDVVVKTNHTTGANIFVRGGAFDRPRIERGMRRSLSKGYGFHKHEWGYFGIPRRVFVERMVPGGARVEEVKFYTFGRRIEMVFRSVDRQGNAGAQIRLLDGAGDIALSELVPNAVKSRRDWPLPDNWHHMVEVARDIGAIFDHMRVDLLTNGSDAWLSELTIYNQGGYQVLFGRDPDAQITRAWDIRRSWFMTTPQPGWRGEYADALRRVLDAEAEAAPPLAPA